MPIPNKIHITAVITKVNKIFPLDSTKITELSFNPMPVCAIQPTIIPDIAVAIATTTMFLEDRTKPSYKSFSELRKTLNREVLVRENMYSNISFVIRIKINTNIVQYAEREGDKCSIIKHQTSTMIGIMQCIPEKKILTGSEPVTISSLSALSIYFGVYLQN